MSEIATTTTLYMPGRGCDIDADGQFTLSPSSLARVNTAAEYFKAHRLLFEKEAGLIVCSGGWSGISSNMAVPPEEYREGRLMHEALYNAGVPDQYIAEEILSSSTLESCIECDKAGFFKNIDSEHPLGIVAQQAHMPRIRYFSKKIFNLPYSLLRPIRVVGEEGLAMELSEDLFFLGTLAIFLNARSISDFRRREAILKSVTQRLRLHPAKLYTTHETNERPQSVALIHENKG